MIRQTPGASHVRGVWLPVALLLGPLGGFQVVLALLSGLAGIGLLLLASGVWQLSAAVAFLTFGRSSNSRWLTAYGRLAGIAGLVGYVVVVVNAILFFAAQGIGRGSWSEILGTFLILAMYRALFLLLASSSQSEPGTSTDENRGL